MWAGSSGARPILRSVDPTTVSYEFGAAYQGGVFPAEATSVGEAYIVRDHRGVNVRLYPVPWDVDRGVLRVLERMTYEVVTEGKGGANVKKRNISSPSSTFEALYDQRFVNRDRAATRASSPSSPSPLSRRPPGDDRTRRGRRW